MSFIGESISPKKVKMDDKLGIYRDCYIALDT